MFDIGFEDFKEKMETFTRILKEKETTLKEQKEETAQHDIWDDYWIVFKHGEYVSGTDEFGYPLHTKDKSKAFKFYNFNTAMSFFNLGYSVIKC